MHKEMPGGRTGRPRCASAWASPLPPAPIRSNHSQGGLNNRQ